MPTFGLICEGQTDGAVLWPLLCGIVGEQVQVNPVQPPREAGAPAGWVQVFASLRRGDVSQALVYNDFVVVRVDSDVCECAGFDVSRRRDGRPLAHPELAIAVENRLRELIFTADPDADLSRVAFAVAVDSIECWLLLHVNPRKPKDTGCFDAVDRDLRKRDLPGLGRADAKNVRAYEAAARELRRAKVVNALLPHSPSMLRFIRAVRVLPPPLQRNP